MTEDDDAKVRRIVEALGSEEEDAKAAELIRQTNAAIGEADRWADLRLTRLDPEELDRALEGFRSDLNAVIKTAEGSNSRLTAQKQGTAQALIAATSLADVEEAIENMSGNFTDHLQESNRQIGSLATTSNKVLPAILKELVDSRNDQKEAHRLAKISIAVAVISAVIAVIAIGVGVAIAQ